MLSRLFDGLRNVAANLGTGGDKAAYSTYSLPSAQPQEVYAAYMTSLFGLVVDIRSEDTFREWRAWQAEPDQIEAIEKEEKRLGLKLKFAEADRQAQITGGAAIYMGGLPGSPEMPVNLNSVSAGAWKFATVLPKQKAAATERVTDPTDPNYGQPSYYMLGMQRIHPSRIIRFVGNPWPDADQNWDGYGVSCYVALRTALQHLDLSMAEAAALMTEAKIDVMKIPGLTENFATAEYENLLMRRMTTAALMKSTANVLIMDAGGSDGKGGEEYEQKTISFAGIPDVIDRQMLMLSAITSIPQTRLYGRAPQGMNATGDSDARNWAQTVATRQDLKITPQIGGADEILIRSALGARPPEIWYEWNPIYSLGEKEEAEIEKLYADGFVARVNTGAIDEAVLAKAERNRMVETGRYPGIEAAIEESDNDGVVDPEERAEAERMQMEAEAKIAGAQNGE